MGISLFLKNTCGNRTLALAEGITQDGLDLTPTSILRKTFFCHINIVLLSILCYHRIYVGELQQLLLWYYTGVERPVKALPVGGGAHCSSEIVWCMVIGSGKTWLLWNGARITHRLGCSICSAKVSWEGEAGSWPGSPLCGPLSSAVF